MHTIEYGLESKYKVLSITFLFKSFGTGEIQLHKHILRNYNKSLAVQQLNCAKLLFTQIKQCFA